MAVDMSPSSMHSGKKEWKKYLAYFIEYCSVNLKKDKKF